MQILFCIDKARKRSFTEVALNSVLEENVASAIDFSWEFYYLWIPMDTSERRLLSLYIQLQILSSFQVGWIKTGWFGVIFELDKFTFPVLVQTILKTVDTGGIN